MPKITLKQLYSEPPGPRRAYLALKRVGLSQDAVAYQCNCDRSMVSRVIGQGWCTTDLHRRIRAALVDMTGQTEDFLFAHAEKKRQGDASQLPVARKAS